MFEHFQLSIAVFLVVLHAASLLHHELCTSTSATLNVNVVPAVVGDYADTTLFFLFSAIGTEFTVIIPTVDDSAFENTESFFGNIRFAGVPLAAVTLAPDQAEVFITDDDGTFCSITIFLVHTGKGRFLCVKVKAAFLCVY